MERVALWWRRHIIGGLHDHEEGAERADCDGCRYEDDVLWPPPAAAVHARTSGPREMSGSGDRSEPEEVNTGGAVGR